MDVWRPGNYLNEALPDRGMAEDSDSAGVEGLWENRTVYIAVALVALGILFAAVFYMGGGDSPQQPVTPEENDTEDGGNFSEYAGASEETGSTDVEETTDIQATFNINEYGIAPANTEIGIGEAVEFVNQNDFDVRLEFDRTGEEPVLEPGDSIAMKFRGITYFTAYEVEDDREIGSGKINVQ